ncbi:MAG: hypothetical protein KTR25_20735 [Myxococcales bacterium]|nr:hypothetical protein [Myxococcales bacterium]
MVCRIIVTMVGIARQRHEFRASWWIRGSVLTALLAWTGLGVWVMLYERLPARVLATIAFFILFYVAFTLYYWRIHYVADDTGLTVHGDHFPWESIESVERSSLPLVGWEVTTQKGRFVLDLFVRRRALLLDVIVARAGLFPAPGNS